MKRPIPRNNVDDMSTRHDPPEASLYIASGCAHCPTVLKGMNELIEQGAIARLTVTNLDTAQATLLGQLASSGLRVRRFEIVQPDLEDIFLRLTQNGS